MGKRKILIDTDTGSDDAVALAMALREPSFEVVAITTVAGNVPLKTATANALMTMDYADCYYPPVYMGCPEPLFHKLITADAVHGKDGMGDTGTLIPSVRKPEKQHAVNTIIEYAKTGEVELHTLGPLTNIAAAIIKDPQAMRKVPHITMMGGAYFRGNVGPIAEFNFWQDAEAADIVFNFGIPITTVTIEACNDPQARILEEEILYLQNCGSRLAKFCVDCNSALYRATAEGSGQKYIGLADPTATAVLARPELIEESIKSYTRIDICGEMTYGMTVNDTRDEKNNLYVAKSVKLQPHNCHLVYKVKGAEFKKYLISLLV